MNKSNPIISKPHPECLSLKFLSSNFLCHRLSISFIKFCIVWIHTQPRFLLTKIAFPPTSSKTVLFVGESLPLIFWITFIFWIIIFIFWILHVHMFCLCILDFLEPAVSKIFWPLLRAGSKGTSTFSNAAAVTALLLTKSPHADPSLKGSTNSHLVTMGPSSKHPKS